MAQRLKALAALTNGTHIWILTVTLGNTQLPATLAWGYLMLRHPKAPAHMSHTPQNTNKNTFKGNRIPLLIPYLLLYHLCVLELQRELAWLTSSCPKGSHLLFLKMTVKRLCYLWYYADYKEKGQLNPDVLNRIFSLCPAKQFALGRHFTLLLPPQCLTTFHGFGPLHILASTPQQCTSVTSGHVLCQKPSNEQGNYCGLCLRQTWSGWNSRHFINNYNLMIINRIKVKGDIKNAIWMRPSR